MTVKRLAVVPFVRATALARLRGHVSQSCRIVTNPHLAIRHDRPRDCPHGRSVSPATHCAGGHPNDC
jgi:hypothetical protein